MCAEPPRLVFSPEIYNDGFAFLEMSPLQRLLSARQPCGFDGNLSNIPEWAQGRLTRDARETLGNPMAYLATGPMCCSKPFAMHSETARSL